MTIIIGYNGWFYSLYWLNPDLYLVYLHQGQNCNYRRTNCVENPQKLLIASTLMCGSCVCEEVVCHNYTIITDP